MQPQEFIAKWQNSSFGESQAAQSFFNDICALVDHPDPISYGNRDVFTFEKWVPGGFADAYLEDHFGWEFKGDDSELDSALNQLLRYQVHLKTPPLLIVSSFRTIRIQTNFPGMATEQHVIPVAALDQKDHLDKLRWAFHAPAQFRPDRTLDAATKETADLFFAIVRDMEQHIDDPEKLARYLNQIVFCLYAEDAGLLPNGLFSRIVRQHNHDPNTFDQAVRSLFEQMARIEGGLFGADNVSYFNGDLFSSVDTVLFSDVALYHLDQAAQRDWRNIEPSIFGTLFERALDASKRSQLGAHYTGAADIDLVVEPVVMDPLRREWDTAQREATSLADDGNEDAARARLAAFQDRLASVKVLDPACGSGNFLYTALRSLLDLEKQVIDFNDAKDWEEMYPAVRPNQMLGLEINPYAAELARTALWIGYIQWHLSNGVHYRQTPILTPIDTIRQTDAILDLSDPDTPAEPEWPAAEFIIGNPPFLGRGKPRRELGDNYVDAVFGVYKGRLPRTSDICCYWFEKARRAIEQGDSKRAGLLGTQGIRGKDNRTVLERIKRSGDIFLAYSDKEWVLEGAAVHISIVGFDDGAENDREFDGHPVARPINANLTVSADITLAQPLSENAGLAFEGPSPKAPFDIRADIATRMLSQPVNLNGRPNSEVVRPVMNAKDITQNPRGMFTIDFGTMGMNEASLYEMPFEHIKELVYPKRLEKSQASHLKRWWQYARPRPQIREVIAGLSRYIATPRVSKHRIFVWVDPKVLCNDSTDVFARDDDYTFGVLHSRFHELWARAMGTQLREAESGFRYTPTTCFETFPVPDDAQREAIANAAGKLNELREGWLNPPDAKEVELKRRTLTNLYNKPPTWLANAHDALDAAVAAAYGWPGDLSDAEILEKLLALNLERAAAQQD